MTKANQFAIDHGIDFNVGLVSQKVEELVKLTKEVNRRDKDKTAAMPVFAAGQVILPTTQN